jgi:hypothetical protein
LAFFKQYQNSIKSLAVAAMLLAASPNLLADDVESRASGDQDGNGAASIQPSDNLCFGGLEDGKIIVSEPYLKNPYQETTRLGCEVDGGAPVTMPDLPAPDAAKTRMV